MIRIRQSRPEDGQQAIEIWRAAVDATHHFLSPEDRRAIDAEVCAFLPELPLWLALDNSDHPIAFMGLVGASLEALFVHPSYHRCGIGRALVDHALGFEPVLTTTVNEQNPRALAFYERLEFRRIGRSERDEQGRAYPILHMRLAASSSERSRISSVGTIR